MLGWGGQNPLSGPNDDELGPRFPPMADLYDAELLQLAEEASAACNVPVQKGVYIVFAGPTLRRRAKLRLFLAQWGDAVGMSTVPEVIVARHGDGPQQDARAGHLEYHQHGTARQQRDREP